MDDFDDETEIELGDFDRLLEECTAQPSQRNLERLKDAFQEIKMVRGWAETEAARTALEDYFFRFFPHEHL